MAPSPKTEIPESLQKSVDNIIKKEGYVTYEVDKQPVNVEGIGFLSSSYTVDVKGTTKDGEKETMIFVKGIIPSDKLQEINLPQAYAAEAFVYNELYQVFEELQNEVGIPAQERFKIIKSYGESNSEGIFLENVAVKGYIPCDRTSVMTLDVAEMALKEIAKFHALSFVIKERRPEYYENKIKSVKHPFAFSEEWREGVTNIARLAAKRGNLKGDAKQKLDKFLQNYASKWTNYQLDQTPTKYCLCHGDFRLNNLLMKHVGNKLEDMYVVDYQMINFSCPINDILFLIFLNSNQQFRRQHLDHLIDLYYSSFRGFLKNFDLDSEDVYPKKEFLNDYKERLDYGLIVALFYMVFFLADTMTIPDFGTQNMAEMDFDVLDLFPERLQGVVDDFIEWGYL